MFLKKKKLFTLFLLNFIVSGAIPPDDLLKDESGNLLADESGNFLKA